MQQKLKKINNIVKLISRPHRKFWPDPFMHQLVWNQNITNFYNTFAFFLFFSLVSIICNFLLHIKLLEIGTILLQICVFLLFCRSHLWVYNLFFAISSLILIGLVLETTPDAVYYCIGFNLILAAAIMRKTRDAKITLLSGVAQAFLFFAKFKDQLIIAIRDEEPEIFADQFTKTTLACYFIVLLMSVIMFKTLDKRTLELSRSKAALEIALEQQKTFVFSFSHELRNPINSLLGNLQLVLQGETLSTKTAEMINVAKVCGELLMHNINNVLDTGKHDIGKLEVNPVPTRLYELFQRTWSIYSEFLRQKRLKSQLKIDKDLPAMVKIDSHKVNQILLNLIGNAIKFTEKGSIMVTVKWLKCNEVSEKCFQPVPYDDTDEGLFEKEENLSTRLTQSNVKFLSEIRRLDNHYGDTNHQEEAKGVLKIIVKDTGSGMKQEALRELFKKFSQVSENISQRQIGTGLGLFITKEICLAMGGEIRAYSKFGTGTTFVVCIPTTSVPVPSTQRADTQSVINTLKCKQIKALVVDDSPFNVNLICDYLLQFGGSTVAVAYNGHDTCKKYREYQESNVGIDVVILDIAMPIMDGRKVCDCIRKYEAEKRLRPVLIILISGNYDKEQIEEYVDPKRGRRADCFLRKPVSFAEFTRTVYNLISHW